MNKLNRFYIFFIIKGFFIYFINFFSYIIDKNIYLPYILIIEMKNLLLVLLISVAISAPQADKMTTVPVYFLFINQRAILINSLKLHPFTVDILMYKIKIDRLTTCLSNLKMVPIIVIL